MFFISSNITNWQILFKHLSALKQKKRIEERACEQCQGGPNPGTIHLLSVPCPVAISHQPCLLHDTKPWQDTWKVKKANTSQAQANHKQIFILICFTLVSTDHWIENQYYNQTIATLKMHYFIISHVLQGNISAWHVWSTSKYKMHKFLYH